MQTIKQQYIHSALHTMLFRNMVLMITFLLSPLTHKSKSIVIFIHIIYNNQINKYFGSSCWVQSTLGKKRSDGNTFKRFTKYIYFCSQWTFLFVKQNCSQQTFCFLPSPNGLFYFEPKELCLANGCFENVYYEHYNNIYFFPFMSRSKQEPYHIKVDIQHFNNVERREKLANQMT